MNIEQYFLFLWLIFLLSGQTQFCAKEKTKETCILNLLQYSNELEKCNKWKDKTLCAENAEIKSKVCGEVIEKENQL